MSVPSTIAPRGFEPFRRPPYPLAGPMPAHPASRVAPQPMSRGLPALDLGRIAKNVLLITLLLLLNIFGNVGAAVFFAILAMMVVYSPSAAFKALIIMWLGLMLNHALVPKSLTWTPCRLILPYLCLVRFSVDIISLRTSLFTQPFYVAFLVYCATMALCSFISGWYTAVALFKLANFWAAFTSVFAGAFVLIRKRIDIGEWLVSLIMSATSIGLIAIAIGKSKISFGVGDSVHFGGAFLHPNCHSSYGSLFVVSLFAIYAFSPYRRRWLVFPLLAIWAVFIAWSRSRTAVLATSLGFMAMIPFMVSSLRPAGWIRRVNISRGTMAALVFAACVLLGVADVATGNRISQAVIAFVNKSDRVDDRGDVSLNVDDVLYSRASKIDESVANFRENPVFGIGFQVAKSEAFIRNATIFTAPVEKGFLPTAVLEEGGIVGACAFMVFILAMPLTFIFQRNGPALAAFFTFIGSSLTEVSVFSPGGSGGFGWVMVAAAYVFGESCWALRRTAGRAPAPSGLNVARPGLARLPDPRLGPGVAG
ncbi:MAG: hypothetical protein EBR86_05775 [Planctomycetia bacterium]|nr:hypothetical protein [Planctomycetia bacterium]